MQKRTALFTNIVIAALTLGITGCATQQAKTVNTSPTLNTPANTAYSLDQQNTTTKTQLRGTGVYVIEIENSNDIVLVMPSHIHFNSASAELSPAFKNVLNTVAKVMNDYPFTVAEIPGHTDSIGSAQYNMQLSGLRAQAVADYLMTKGIEKNRLVPVAYGETHPLFVDNTSAGRAMNRRVEIILHSPQTTGIDHIAPVQGNKK